MKKIDKLLNNYIKIFQLTLLKIAVQKGLKRYNGNKQNLNFFSLTHNTITNKSLIVQTQF